MNLAALVLILALGVVAAFLARRLRKSSKKIKSLQQNEESLISERARQSDQLRLKGIEIDGLKKELEKYSNTEIKVALTGKEKLMLLNALDEIYEDLGIKEKVFNAPPGKYRLRKDLTGLDVIPIKLEIKTKSESEKESEPQKGAESQGTSEEKGC